VYDVDPTLQRRRTRSAPNAIPSAGVGVDIVHREMMAAFSRRAAMGAHLPDADEPDIHARLS